MSQNTAARASNPAEQAKILKGQTAPLQAQDQSVTYSVNLGVTDGEFVLNWNVTPQVYGRWDWVGVFKSAYDAETDPDGTYLGGGWQWAENGSPYQTGVDANNGYVIAYIVWNYDADAYQSVAVSNPY